MPGAEFEPTFWPGGGMGVSWVEARPFVRLGTSSGPYDHPRLEHCVEHDYCRAGLAHGLEPARDCWLSRQPEDTPELRVARGLWTMRHADE